MPLNVEVLMQHWVAAPEPWVRAHFLDLPRHEVPQVHPGLRMVVQALSYRRARYVLERKRWGRWQRDAFVRETEPDGTVVDTCVEGPRRGASWSWHFMSSSLAQQPGTMVEVAVHCPLAGWAASWRAKGLKRRLRSELLRTLQENQFDLEKRGYRPEQPPQTKAA